MKSTLNFLTPKLVRELVGKYGTPCYVMSRTQLEKSANHFLDAIKQLPFGGSVHFAMKANPHHETLHLFKSKNIGIDASSFYEAKKALDCGFSGNSISLTSQELPKTDEEFSMLVDAGVQFNATSLHQLDTFCRLFPGKSLGVRLNPGIGSGYNMRLSTGGVSAGFGIWYEYIEKVLERAMLSGNAIVRVHTHIGTGTDPMEWRRALQVTLELAERFPDIATVNIGGGFKAEYMPGDHDAHMDDIVKILAGELIEFFNKTGKKLSLDLEPGRLLVVHAGALVSKIIDSTDTGEEGYNFLRLDTGMTEIIRTAMYGAQHPLVVVPKDEARDTETKTRQYVVVGHCCESSDCLTTVKGNPEEVEPRELQCAELGDYMVIEKTGAYCFGMSAVGYNSFPQAPIIFIDQKGLDSIKKMSKLVSVEL